jgi:hypothetical protein
MASSSTGGLRQRKANKASNKKSSTQDKDAKKSKRSGKTISKNDTKKGVALLVAILAIYFPMLAVVNPTTFPKWIGKLYPPVCEGICEVTVTEGDFCSPLDTDRLVFVRIPKTASSSLLQLFAEQRRKATAAFDLGELEDLVSSIQVEDVKDQPGFHDPKTRQSRLREFYRDSAQSVLYPAFSNQLRTLFQGHLHYFDFETFVPLYFPNSTSIVPDWVLDLYNRKYPKAPLTIPQFTILRNPQRRMASMYHYDRAGARTQDWRNQFVAQRGNETLEDCLQSSTCVADNDLARWCNLQTEILCGTDCLRGDSESALEQAKIVIKEKFFFVGLVERLPESLKLLSHYIPTYLEDVSNMPHVKASCRPELSDKSLKKLKEICRFDQELYDFADELLTQRLQQCSIE